MLWVLTLLTVLAGSFAYTMRQEIRLAQYSQGSAQARLLVEAAVQQAAFELRRDPLLRRWPVDDQPQTWTFAETELTVRLLDQSGLIDLNVADPRLLDGLLATAGAVGDPQQRAALVDAIQDWRDFDPDARLNGAEDADYERAGRPYGAKDAPFASVEELQQVLGMDLNLYGKIAPALTVFGLQAGINPQVAPTIVLNAVPGLDPAIVMSYLQLRGTPGAEGILQNLPGVDSTLLSGQGQFLYRVQVEARTVAGQVLLEAVLNVPPGGTQAENGIEGNARLFDILLWQTLWPASGDAHEAAT